MGIMRAGLTNEAYDRQYTNRELFGRIAAYFRPSGRRMTVLMVLVTIISLVGAVQPVLVAWGVNVVDSNAANRDLLAALLVIGVLVIGVVNWLLNWARRLLTVQVLGDVVLAMRTDAFRAVMSHDMSFFDQYPVGAHRQPHHQRHRRVQPRGRRADRAPLAGAARRHPAGLSLHHQLAADADAGAAGAGGLYHCRLLSRLGAAGHAPQPAGRGRRQRQHPGGGDRHCRIQELPPRAGHLRRVPGRQHAELRHPRAARLCAVADLPDAPVLQRAGHGGAAAGRRLLHLSRHHLGGRLVSVYEQRVALLVSDDQPVGLLEPVPGRAERHRAHLCPDRRRTGRLPDGGRAGRGAARRHPVRARRLPLRQPRSRC